MTFGEAGWEFEGGAGLGFNPNHLNFRLGFEARSFVHFQYAPRLLLLYLPSTRHTTPQLRVELDQEHMPPGLRLETGYQNMI